MTRTAQVVVTAAMTALMSAISSGAVQDPEAAARTAEEAGKLREAFGLYVQAHKTLPDPLPHDVDVRLRGRIVRLAAKLDPPPDVPEEAQRFSVRGRLAFSQASDEDGFDAAAAELKKAVRAAPWVAAFAFNLALVQEKLSEFDAAIANLKIYELANPPDLDQAKTKRFELEYQAEKFADDLTVTYRQVDLPGPKVVVMEPHRHWIAGQSARSSSRILEYPDTIVVLDMAKKVATKWGPALHRQHSDLARNKDAEKFTKKLRESRPVLTVGATRTIAGLQCTEHTLTVDKLVSARSCMARDVRVPSGYTATLANFQPGRFDYSPALSFRLIADVLWEYMWTLARLPVNDSRHRLHLALSTETAHGVKGGPIDLAWEAVDVKRGAVRPSILRPPRGFKLEVPIALSAGSAQAP